MQFTSNELYMLLNLHPSDRRLWLRGADLRGANLRGADLSGEIQLTYPGHRKPATA